VTFAGSKYACLMPTRLLSAECGRGAPTISSAIAPDQAIRECSGRTRKPSSLALQKGSLSQRLVTPNDINDLLVA